MTNTLRGDLRLIGRQTLGIFLAVLALVAVLAVVVPRSPAGAHHQTCTTVTTGDWGVIGYQQIVVDTHYHATYPYVTYTYDSVPVYGYRTYQRCEPAPHWEHEDTATDIACKGSRIVPLWGAVFYQVCRQW